MLALQVAAGDPPSHPAPPHTPSPSAARPAPRQSLPPYVGQVAEGELHLGTLVGVGQFAEVYQTTWRGTTLAAKVQ